MPGLPDEAEVTLNLLKEGSDLSWLLRLLERPLLSAAQPLQLTGLPTDRLAPGKPPGEAGGGADDAPAGAPAPVHPTRALGGETPALQGSGGRYRRALFACGDRASALHGKGEGRYDDFPMHTGSSAQGPIPYFLPAGGGPISFSRQ